MRSRHRSEHRSKHCIASQSIAVQVIFGDYNGDFEIGSVQYRKVAEKIKKKSRKKTEVGYNQCHVKHRFQERRRVCHASKQASSGVVVFFSFLFFSGSGLSIMCMITGRKKMQQPKHQAGRAARLLAAAAGQTTRTTWPDSSGSRRK